MQCFQCLPCISLGSEHHQSLECMTPCFWSHWLAFYSFLMFHNKENRNEIVYMLEIKVEWQEYNCLNPPSHDCRRKSRRKLLFSVIPLNVAQLYSDRQTDVWKSMVYFVSLSIKYHSWDKPSWRICGLGFFLYFLLWNVFIDATTWHLLCWLFNQKEGEGKERKFEEGSWILMPKTSFLQERHLTASIHCCILWPSKPWKCCGSRCTALVS